MASVYVETTIPSYLVAKPSRDLVVAAHQQITQEWWTNAKDRFDLYVSEAVLSEISLGDAVCPAFGPYRSGSKRYTPLCVRRGI
jgi:hypothetical protein